MVANDRWRSMEPVGLRRRLGLLRAGGLMLNCGGRLRRTFCSSAPIKELVVEFKMELMRSKRLPTGSVLGLVSSSLLPMFVRSFRSPVSGSEPVWNSERWTGLFSGEASPGADLLPPKMTLLPRREPGLEGGDTPFPFSTWDCKSSKGESEDFLSGELLMLVLRGEFSPLACCWSCR